MAPGVAAIGRSGRQVIVITYMANGAGYIGMAVGQRKTGGAVIEFCVQPIVKRSMTICAIRSRKRGSRGLMRRISGPLPILQVAGLASRRKPHIISHCGIRMALIALHHRVRAEQRKAVEVVLNRLIGYLPPKRCVALSAIGSHLPVVNIRMAIGAIFPYVREYRLRVAARA